MKKIIIATILTCLVLSTSSVSAIFSSNSTNNFSFEASIINFSKEKWVVIICGGADPNSPEGKAGPIPIRNTSRHAYETFKLLGYDDDHIYYLHDNNYSAEGADDIVSRINIRNAFTEWLASHSDENDECCIVFIGHGGPFLLSIWNYEDEIAEFIFAAEFAAWINTVESNLTTIIIDACFSGSLISSLSKENRIIITGTSPLSPGLALFELVFSYHFFNKLSKNISYGKAWEHADKQISRRNISDIMPNLGGNLWDKLILYIKIKLGTFMQNPKIDDNGDRKGRGTLWADNLPIKGDGNLALDTYPKY